MSKNSFKNPENLLLLGTTTLSFFFFLWGVNSWKFSFVGDEWPFYAFAKNLAMHPHMLNPLSFSGVYGTHSPLISIYQALFMKVFGITNFAWRLSNCILIFPLSFFFYRWIKVSFTKEVALLSTILLQCSFYLANFFKIGYDNPQSLTVFIVCLYLAACFGKTPSKKLGFLLGGTLGIAFYSYFGPAFPIFIWPYLLPLRKLLHTETRKALLLMVGTYLLALSPLLFQLSSLPHVVQSLGNPQSFHVKSIVFYDLFLFYQNHDYFYNHFVVGPYLDVITQIVCLVGTIAVVLRLKQKPYLLLLFSYLSSLLFIGSTSSDFVSPTTRGIFLLPYGFIFAGMGLNLLRETIQDKVLSFAFCWLLFLAIATLNVYQSQIGVFNDHKAGYTGMALLLGTLQQAQSTKKTVIVILSPSLTINSYFWMLPYMTQAYGLSHVTYTIIHPDNFSCSFSRNNTTVLLFKHDFAAQQKVKEMNCVTPVTFSLLSPTITNF